MRMKATRLSLTSWYGRNKPARPLTDDRQSKPRLCQVIWLLARTIISDYLSRQIRWQSCAA